MNETSQSPALPESGALPGILDALMQCSRDPLLLVSDVGARLTDAAVKELSADSETVTAEELEDLLQTELPVGEILERAKTAPQQVKSKRGIAFELEQATEACGYAVYRISPRKACDRDDLSRFPLPALQARQDLGVFCVSRGLIELTGQPEGALLGEGWLELVHPGDRDGLRAAMEKSLETGKDLRIQCRFLARGQEFRWVIVSGNCALRSDKKRVVTGVLVEASFEGAANVADKPPERILPEGGESHDDPENERLRMIVGVMDDLVCAVDCEFRFIAFNRAYATTVKGLYGAEIELGMRLQEVVKDDASAVRVTSIGNWTRAISGEQFRTRREIRQKDGRRRVFEQHFHPLKDENGKRFGAAQTMRDVTEEARKNEEQELLRRELEQRMHERTEELNALLGNAPVGFALFDSDLRYLRVNPAIASVIGRPATEFIGKRFGEMTGWGETLCPQLKSVLETGKPVDNVEVSLPCEKGPDRHFLLALYPVKGAGGVVKQVGFLALDISDRKRAETELAQTESRYRQLLQAGRDSVVIYPIGRDGAPGKFTEVNDEACRRYGYTRQELLSMSVFDLVDKPAEELLGLLKRVREGKPVVMETMHVCGDGRRLPVEVSTSMHIVDGQEYVVTTSRDITERLKAQQKLLESQKLFKRLAEASPDLLYVYDLVSRANVYCNRELERVLGYSPREVKALSDRILQSLVHTQDLGRVQKHTEAMGEIEEGEVREIEYRVVAADGDCRWLRCRETLFLRGDDGRPQQIIGIAQDVTERRRHEQLLEESRNRLDLALTTGRMGLWDWDLQNNLMVFSEGHYRLLGFAPGEEPPSLQNMVERVHPEDRTAMEGWFRQTLSEGTELQGEWRSLWPDGSVHWLEIRGRLYSDNEGRAVRMTGVISDIDRRKKNEEQLRQSEARFRSTFETAAVGMALVGMDGRWLRVNEALCNIVGYTQEELSQKTFQELTHPDDLADDLTQLSQLREGEIDDYRLEKRYIHKKGHEVWVRLTVSMLRAESEQPHYISVIQDITARKRAEQALRDSDSRHRALFDDSPLSMIVVDAETLEVVQFNDEAHRALGYSRGEFEKLSLGDVMLMPEGRLQKLVQETVRTGQSRQYETQFTRKDGTVLDVLTTARPLKIEGRTYQLTTSQDISARKLAESEANRLIQQVTQANALLDNLIENAPLGIAFYDRAMRFVRVNEALAAMNGIAAEEHVGQTPHQLLPGKLEDAEAVLERIMQTRRPMRKLMEGETPALPGERRQWEVVYYPVEAGGELLGVGAISEDVTDRRRAQDAILRANQKIRSIVESIGDGFISVDRNFRVTYINASATEMLSVGVATAHLRVLWEVFPGSGADILLERLQKTQDAQTDQHFELFFDELNRWFDIRFYSRSEGLSVFFADITERKRAETALREAKEEAEAANRSKSAFLASMSHDIRTPLTSILGFAELLAERVGAGEREHAETIRQSGERLMETLESVLALARLEGKQLQLKPALIDAAEELRSAQRILKQQAEKRGLSLDLETPQAPVQIKVDRSALNRALMNLVGNSLKFTREGSIRLRLKRSRDKAIIEVSDTGCGIPKEFLPKVFLAFERGTDGASDAPEGSGLGLAITKQIVEYMDGTISVRSEVGKGTTFTMEFPITKDAETTDAKPESPRTERPDMATRRKMLVVEDYQNIRTILRVMLEEHYEIKMAATVGEALEIAKEFEADIALLDINIEEKNSGVDLLHQLRGMRHYADRPIVAFTAYAMPEDQERFTSLGFDSVLVKPFTRQSLESALSQAFSSKE